jgi:hypothetical protein
VTQHLADLAGEPRADRLDHEAIAIRIDREDPLERMVLLRVGLDVAQEAADLLDLLGQNGRRTSRFQRDRRRRCGGSRAFVAVGVGGRRLPGRAAVVIGDRPRRRSGTATRRAAYRPGIQRSRAIRADRAAVPRRACCARTSRSRRLPIQRGD